MSAELVVLYEDNHCLAVAKPAGWLTMGDATGDPTLLNNARHYLRQKFAKPGAVFLGVVHRLDRPVSGVVLFARTSKAAARLSAQFRAGTIEKVYWAVVAGRHVPREGELRHSLVKDAARNRAVVADAETGRDSRLHFHRKGRHGAWVWLEVRPLTGRSHQIRAQLSAAGWPILGDRKYGSREPFVPGAIALHARALTFTHPVRREPVTVVCPLPETWRRFAVLGMEPFFAGG
uniref:RluA family pseudouridine synthase n=1 Tax=Schlesneria paludicola TaxID=360056 RepID=A0A7C4QP00_9PLAN